MPMYTWVDSTSQKSVDVIRSFADSEVPPAREDTEKQMTDAEFTAAQWTKPPVAPQWLRGSNWRGSKGYW